MAPGQAQDLTIAQIGPFIGPAGTDIRDLSLGSQRTLRRSMRKAVSVAESFVTSYMAEVVAALRKAVATLRSTPGFTA